MVNRPFPVRPHEPRDSRVFAVLAARHAPRNGRIRRALSQILPNRRSFKFSENLPRILVENGQKPPSPANCTFKAPC